LISGTFASFTIAASAARPLQKPPPGGSRHLKGEQTNGSDEAFAHRSDQRTPVAVFLKRLGTMAGLICHGIRWMIC
jgi:hypothetical protein